ncbi:MAG: hypothetical protein KC586_18050, partial [Myxococcales bacterium]|nr:hypothetical protein [Myxococcales bacterium]
EQGGELADDLVGDLVTQHERRGGAEVLLDETAQVGPTVGDLGFPGEMERPMQPPRGHRGGGDGTQRLSDDPSGGRRAADLRLSRGGLCHVESMRSR